MIFYLVTRRNVDTLSEYLETWARSQRQLIRPIFYDQLPYLRHLERGTYIFSDLERLKPPQLELAALVYQTIKSADPSAHVWNDPAKALRREPLLRELHRTGHNPFAVYRMEENLDAIRFPVFLRLSRGHEAVSDLLRSRDELNRAIEQSSADGVAADDLLIVEFTDTADSAGLYRKYSVFCLGGRIIPRHVLHSDKWLLKYPKVVTAATVAEEEKYLSENPHEKELAEIFQLAHIDYGRIDYSLLDGRIVTWEINTNPTIAIDPAKVAPVRLGVQWISSKLIRETLAAMDAPDRKPLIRLKVPATLLRSLGIPRRDIALRNAGVLLRRFGAPALAADDGIVAVNNRFTA